MNDYNDYNVPISVVDSPRKLALRSRVDINKWQVLAAATASLLDVENRERVAVDVKLTINGRFPKPASKSSLSGIHPG
ncbi:hypothetical protein [Pseudaminobacter sp. NGMCC 1.201702]|uniref:hypothetical protein n=1 Tax=Pseudaminobacter sp. NGMCC 1.201702 TaxID=3391825 RepID=UPI0039F07E3D